MPLPDNKRELNELLSEAKYYLVQDLVDLCEATLKMKIDEVEPICKVPLITSPKEEQALVASTSKVSS